MTPEQPRELTYDGDALRIEFRQEGWARFLVVAFLLVWLGGWAAGECAALFFLLGMANLDLPFDLPFKVAKFGVGDAMLFPMIFLIIWTSFWTLGGMAALTQVLRLLFGNDVIALAPMEWRVTHRVGPFGRTHVYSASDGWRVLLRPKDSALIAKGPDKQKVLTAMGRPAQRAWLRDEILRRYSLSREATGVPSEWTLEPVAEGTRLRRSRRSLRSRAGCALVPFLIFGTILFFAIRQNGITTSTIVLMLIGALFLWTAIWFVFARESWLIAPNRLEHHLTLFGTRRVHVYRDGELEITSRRDSDGDEFFTLIVRGAANMKRTAISSMNDRDDPQLLGRLFAQKTGWKLIEPGS